VDLAQGGQNLPTEIDISSQDRREVLDYQDATVAELAKQTTGGAGTLVLLRRAAQQGTLRTDGAGDQGASAGQCLDRFGLRRTRSGYQRDPPGTASEPFCGRSSYDCDHRVEVVGWAEPSEAGGSQIGEAFRRWRRRCRRGHPDCCRIAERAELVQCVTCV